MANPLKEEQALGAPLHKPKSFDTIFSTSCRFGFGTFEFQFDQRRGFPADAGIVSSVLAIP
jgi:hypothetical protein